ncbi:MAG: hypothetical protein K5773_05385 [Pseudobutyrivibrio sp.]|nr:hypothetical protein [Pseudobutyrivibrio sp.]
MNLFRKIGKKVKRFIRRHIKRDDYWTDLKEAIDYYNYKHGNSQRAFSFKLICWIFLSMLRQYDSNRKKDLIIGKNIICNYKNPDSTFFNIGVYLIGDLKEYIMEANYINAFLKKYGSDSMKLDLFFHGETELIDVLYRFDYVGQKLNASLKDIEKLKIDHKYDLYIVLDNYPRIKYKNLKKINELRPELLDYILVSEKYEMKNKRMMRYPQMIGQANILSELEGKTFIQKLDIDQHLNITSLDFPVSIQLDEEQYLSCNGLKEDNYIIIATKSDFSNRKKVNNTDWITRYFEKLVPLLKGRLNDKKIVQLRFNEDKELDVDLSLLNVGVEQLMSLLKNASLMICSEGGLVHLRQVLQGGKSVVIFGPNSPSYYGYKGNINLRSDICQYPCEEITDKWKGRCMNASKKACMWALTPEMVIKELDVYE